MEMETNGLDNNVLTQPAELLITCSSAESNATNEAVQDTISQQLTTVTEHYHFIDQNGQAIQYEIQALSDASPQMMILTSDSENGQVFHVIPSSQTGTAQLIIPQGQIQGAQDALEQSATEEQSNADRAAPENTSGFIIQSNATFAVSKKALNRTAVETFQTPLQPLPPSIPAWARRLRSCERIGDSYRGYCMSEAELMSILSLHKQQTQSVWGTRQSPSPAKPATRLMWKSQYVPYDGIPFVNAGSRAIVMECQYGPRRKGVQPRRVVENDNAIYKATCPARIYIKKVKKFPLYRVPTDPKFDKKLIRIEQEKAFNLLKKDPEGTEGVFRWYVQLPDQDAHQYHNLEVPCFSPTPFQPSAEEEEEEVQSEENPSKPSRLHPRVSDKIRELVSRGIDEVYAVRKQLRKFVERDLFKPDEIPERHNLSYFPTVNDLKNHIHEAQKSFENGELIYDPESISGQLNWTTENGNALNEMVTVTFSSTPSEVSDQEPLVVDNSSAEQVCQDPAQMITSLASIQPKIFAQVQELQLQPTFTSSDGATAVITVNPPSLGNPACLLSPGGNNQPLMLSHLPSHQSDAASSLSTLPTPGHNLVSMGQLVTVEEAAGITGEVHQILLGGIHSIPIHIVEAQPTIVEINPIHIFGTDQNEEFKEANVENVSVLEDKTPECQDPVKE
ncbi:calcium-responsive transcription factor [Bombina bombina]|uniref:calcium-responsive transcription factor n=1 Tax=Bombina bombina TaxID=8345 RepID=UPI00235A5ED8|nr:calcium-responsive transcription factor [Bombina bombina]